MRFPLYSILILLVLIFSSCDEEPREKLPDISGINIDVPINRFDLSLGLIDTNSISSSLNELESQYPNLYPIYFERVLSLGKNPKVSMEDDIRGYLTNTNTRNILDTVKVEYREMAAFEQQFNKAFSYLKYYLPDFNPPHLYTLVSDFGLQRFLFDDVEADGIGIGLDMFLGETFPYKSLDPQNPAFSDYLTRSFNKDHLVRKVMEMIIGDQIQNRSGVRLIDQMIFNGKKLYLLDKVLPMVSDTVIHEYSARQLSFCKASELEMWSFFVEEELLYETNQSKIGKYLNPSPSSPNMPAAAPGRTANYLGLQIIKAFMRKHPEMSIIDLFAWNDSQALLDKSRYRPKR